MSDLQTMIATAPDGSLSLGELLRRLQRRQRLRPLVMEALAEAVVVTAARQAGRSVSDAELRQAADRLRRRHGLASAEQTNAWLARQRPPVPDFEEALERDQSPGQPRGPVGPGTPPVSRAA